LARHRSVAFTCDIRLSDDPDELSVLIDNRKTAHLVPGHLSQHFIEVLLRTDSDELRRRHFANLHLIGVSPLRCHPMSRSVSIPINMSPSTIGARPTSSSRIIFAAYATDLSASMVQGLEVMTSRVC
jgi:hypothetical protein